MGKGPFCDLAGRPMPRPWVGVSACLLGERVRYDGTDKRSAVVAELLAEWFDFRSICPEVGAGLGTPRPAIQLVRTKEGLRALGVYEAGLDVTADLERFSGEVVAGVDVSGFILKSRSPSCGRVDTEIHDAEGRVVAQGRGLFVRVLLSAFPLLPLEDEQSLEDDEVRECFVFRVHLYAAWRQAFEAFDEKEVSNELTMHERLRAYHARYAGRVTGWAPEAEDRLEKIVEGMGPGNLKSSLHNYFEAMMNALAKFASSRS